MASKALTVRIDERIFKKVKAAARKSGVKMYVHVERILGESVEGKAGDGQPKD